MYQPQQELRSFSVAASEPERLLGPEGNRRHDSRSTSSNSRTEARDKDLYQFERISVRSGSL